MSIPNIKDYARITPPWASIDPGRSPVIKWHASRGAAKVSAQSDAWGLRDLPPDDERNSYSNHEWYAKRDHAIAVLAPNGDLVIEETWLAGTTRRY